MAKINWQAHKVQCLNSDFDYSILVALVSDLPIEGIEETDDGIVLHYHKSEITQNDVMSVCKALNVEFAHEIELMPNINWNRQWESSYQPISIEDFLIIYAHFHQVDITAYQYSIEITPQMSFGTGHHETTRLMVNQMRKMVFEGKSVLDFGTGTGILAMLASKLHAKEIVAIENIPHALENAVDNANKNKIDNISFKLTDHAKCTDQKFDIQLVNIVRSVILDNIQTLANQSTDGGELLLSGFLSNDSEKIRFKAKQYGFLFVEQNHDGKWICQRYQKRATA